VPVMASLFLDMAGRTMSGQTLEAFWNSISHAPLLSVGLNCAFGPDLMRPHIEELSRIAPIYVSAYPNAGLPDPLSETGFPETPETLAPNLGKWSKNGWLNLVGGCCGTTPEHIRTIAQAGRDCKPRAFNGGMTSVSSPISGTRSPQGGASLQLSGFEPL